MERMATSPVPGQSSGQALGKGMTATARYARALQRAASLIRARGTAMVVVQEAVAGPYDPVLDGRPTRETRTLVMGLRVHPRGADASGGAFAAETARVLLAGDALALPPRPKDRLILSGGIWSITATASVAPGDTPLLHLLDLRRVGEASEKSPGAPEEIPVTKPLTQPFHDGGITHALHPAPAGRAVPFSALPSGTGGGL